jgi:hypothetical protein
MRSLRYTVSAALAATLVALPAPELSAQQAPASPRDSVSATIGGATVTVNYGRPSKRGREIFGALVPYGTPWRTGANEATAFTTNRALRFGAVTVPAGRYTLFTLPAKDGPWQLIINKQTGQWGTAYDAAQDLVRIPMTVGPTPAVVEQMQITVAASGAAGELAVLWDRTKAAATFTVVP